MKIAHFAPFAPYVAGIYEAARDMLRADLLCGNEVAFVDVGAFIDGKRMPRQIGAEDFRGGYKLVTVDLEAVKDFDIFIVHDGSQLLADYFANCKAKIVKPIHVRPAACFATQAQNPVYEWYYNESRADRVAAWFTMWDEFMPYWRVIMPEEKLFCTGDPPIDGERFKPEGSHVEFFEGDRGEFNILVADSWREDVDMFHTLHGLITASNFVSGIKVHVYGAPENNQALNLIFTAMKNKGILGEHKPRIKNLADVYRACDLLVTPHVIATRVMAEAICCGLPVLAGNGCRYTPYTCQQDSPYAIAGAIAQIAKEDAPIKSNPAPFSLEKYGNQMSEIYKNILKQRSLQCRNIVHLLKLCEC